MRWKSFFQTLFILVFATAGCSGSRLTEPSVAQEQVIMFEHGEVKHFYAAGAGVIEWSLGDQSNGYFLCLDENRISPKIRNIASVEKNAPPWRRMSSWMDFDLFTLAVATNGSEAELVKPRGPVIWIVGNNPLILARGSETEARRLGWGGSVGDFIALAGTFHLVTTKDLDRRVTTLSILDSWPEVPADYRPGAKYSESLDSDLGHDIWPRVRTINLPTPIPLRQLFANPPRNL